MHGFKNIVVKKSEMLGISKLNIINYKYYHRLISLNVTKFGILYPSDTEMCLCSSLFALDAGVSRATYVTSHFKVWYKTMSVCLIVVSARLILSTSHYRLYRHCSQGARGNFTYLLEGKIHFALKLSVGCPIKQF